MSDSDIENEAKGPIGIIAFVLSIVSIFVNPLAFLALPVALIATFKGHYGFGIVSIIISGLITAIYLLIGAAILPLFGL